MKAHLTTNYLEAVCFALGKHSGKFFHSGDVYRDTDRDDQLRMYAGELLKTELTPILAETLQMYLDDHETVIALYLTPQAGPMPYIITRRIKAGYQPHDVHVAITFDQFRPEYEGLVNNVETTAEFRFSVGYRTEAGNWVYVLGTNELDRAISHAEFLRGRKQGTAVRIVDEENRCGY